MTTSQLEAPPETAVATMHALVYHGPGKPTWELHARPVLQDSHDAPANAGIGFGLNRGGGHLARQAPRHGERLTSGTPPERMTRMTKVELNGPVRD